VVACGKVGHDPHDRPRHRKRGAQRGKINPGQDREDQCAGAHQRGNRACGHRQLLRLESQQDDVGPCFAHRRRIAQAHTVRCRRKIGIDHGKAMRIEPAGQPPGQHRPTHIAATKQENAQEGLLC
jgi:hypothetical protein